MLQQLLSIFAGLMTIIRGPSGTPAKIQQTTNLPSSSTASCYQPDPTAKFILSPANFLNLADNRPKLNPKEFPPSKFPATFNTKNSCNAMIFTTLSGQTLPTRTYMRIRENVRIASCKTDELAGPYRTDPTICYNVSVDAAAAMRGQCVVAGGSYPDLRKIAEVDDPQNPGQKMEIFWTPYSHNVGCEFNDSKPNCGSGDGTNMNLREFLYVLRARDAFDAAGASDCKVRWDENSRHNNPCSHYFDVYIAQDLWDKLVALPTGAYVPKVTTDPGYDLYRQNYYVMRDRIFNCKESTSFTPMTDPLGFPPEYVELPFVSESKLSTPDSNKIIPENSDPWEIANYKRYIIYNSSGFLSKSLYHIETLDQTFTVCPRPLDVVATPTLIPIGMSPDACYHPLGNISLTNPDGNKPVVFKAYTRDDKAQTIFLKTTSDPKVYLYTPTTNKPPTKFDRNTSLQLTNLDFRTAAQWTWATPVCKPAVYLYPTVPTALKVALNVDGKLTKSIPDYGSKGWDVVAQPDGKLTTHNRQPITNNYLYYEADLNGVKAPEEGFVYSRPEMKSKLTELLTTIGFNSTEINDFLGYWLPRLDKNPYYFVTLLPENVINEKETLSFSTLQPTTHNLQPVIPDTLIRTRVIFEGLETPISVKPIIVPSHTRNGFTVTDWGGSIVGEGCDVNSVQ